MHFLIEQHRTAILEIAERHGLRDMRVFGSMVRGDADDASDVDLLVSLPPQRTGQDLDAVWSVVDRDLRSCRRRPDEWPVPWRHRSRVSGRALGASRTAAVEGGMGARQGRG